MPPPVRRSELRDVAAQISPAHIARRRLSDPTNISSRIDIEQARHSPRDIRNALNGFPWFSQVLAADPSQSSIVFKRFDESSIRNLLLLEARVAALERLRDNFDKEDKVHSVRTTERSATKEVDDFQMISQSWEEFALLGSLTMRWPGVDSIRKDGYDDEEDYPWVAHHILASDRRDILDALDCVTHHREPHEWTEEEEARGDLKGFWGLEVPELSRIGDRWKLAKLTETAIKDYQEALIRYHQLLQIHKPADRTVKAIKTWFNPSNLSPSSGRKGAQFLGAMEEIFNDSKSTDKMPEKARLAKPDFVALARTGKLNEYYSGEDFNYVSEDIITNLSIMIGLLVAMLFLIAAVWTLWGADHDSNPAVALGVLSSWVFIFGFAINYGTNATGDQVLGATAAYAAVLVVFVGQKYDVSSPPDQSAAAGK